MKLSLVLLFALVTGPAWGSLDDFQQDVTDAEANPPPDLPAADEPQDESNPAGDLIAQLFAALWGADNLYTTYGPMPYGDGAFVRLPRFEYSTQQHDYVALVKPGRDQWFTGEASAFTLSTLGTGAWTRVTGHAWRFIGPDVEAWSLTDGHQVLAGARLGARFSLLQSDPFSVALYGQWVGWTGALVRSGAAVGLELKSFPLRPLVLQMRWGLQAFARFQLAEWESQAGFLFGANELFGGWRVWSLPSAQKNSRYQGAFAGWRTYF